MGGNSAVPTLQPDTETKQMFKIDRIDYSWVYSDANNRPGGAKTHRQVQPPTPYLLRERFENISAPIIYNGDLLFYFKLSLCLLNKRDFIPLVNNSGNCITKKAVGLLN